MKIQKHNIDYVKNNLTIDKVFESITHLEDNHLVERGDANLVKWKSRAHQVVVESDSYFYKVYQETNYGVGPFTSLVRGCLTQIYQKMGIDWKQITFERDNSIFDFQQRQKLKVTTVNDGAFGDILLSFSSILDEVEQQLEFESILSQIKHDSNFNDVSCLKLARSCVNKYDDYAVFNSQVILLDDAEFYIALVGEDGVLLKISDGIERSLPVETSYGSFLFTNCSSCEFRESKINLKLSQSNSFDHGWYLFKEPDVPPASDCCEIHQNAIEKGSLVEAKFQNIKHQIEVMERWG